MSESLFRKAFWLESLINYNNRRYRRFTQGRESLPSSESDLSSEEGDEAYYTHALSAAYESINYELVENDLRRNEETNEHHQVHFCVAIHSESFFRAFSTNYKSTAGSSASSSASLRH